MYLQIDNRKIHYKKMGEGEPILFVHGWGGNLYSLHNLALLSSKKYTAYLIDLPGFGKSENPGTEWGIEGYADLIVQFIKTLHLKKPHYVGHSFGGEIGIYISAHFPQIINKLVLCNSAFRRERKISKVARIMKSFPKEKMSIFKFFEPYLKKMYYKLFHRDSDLMKYPHLEKNFRRIITQDLTQETKQIGNPTLILWGEDDTMTPVLWGYQLKKNIPFAKMKVFPKVRHNLPLIKPNEIWTEIEPFLSS